jgi:hypothetical protein
MAVALETIAAVGPAATQHAEQNETPPSHLIQVLHGTEPIAKRRLKEVQRMLGL